MLWVGESSRAPSMSAPVSQRPRLRRLRSGVRVRRAHRLRILQFRGALLLADLTASLIAARLADIGPNHTLVLLAIVIPMFASAGLYREKLTLSALNDLSVLVSRAVVGGALLTMGALIVETVVDARRMLLATLVWAALAGPARGFAYYNIRRLRRLGRRHDATLIIGAGRVGDHIGRVLVEHPAYGRRPVGYIDDRPMLDDSDLPAPILGNEASLASVIQEYDVRTVVIAFSTAQESTLVDMIRQCDRLDCEIFVVPRLFELSQHTVNADHAWGFPLTRLSRPAFQSPMWQLKRAVDVVVSFFALVLLLPLMTVCAALVARETGGVLFRQPRIGLDGREFELLKFQTLRPATSEESATMWSVKEDPRLGSVGRFLRRTSIDELPQLWNILRGDMTLVGPRPERPYFVHQFSTMFPRYMARHRVPSGLTGWAQIHDLRGDTSIEDRVRFDNFYIEHWSLWGDLKILLRTVSSMLRGSGG